MFCFQNRTSKNMKRLTKIFSEYIFCISINNLNKIFKSDTCMCKFKITSRVTAIFVSLFRLFKLYGLDYRYGIEMIKRQEDQESLHHFQETKIPCLDIQCHWNCCRNVHICLNTYQLHVGFKSRKGK